MNTLRLLRGSPLDFCCGNEGTNDRVRRPPDRNREFGIEHWSDPKWSLLSSIPQRYAAVEAKHTRINRSSRLSFGCILIACEGRMKSDDETSPDRFMSGCDRVRTVVCRVSNPCRGRLRNPEFQIQNG